MVWQQEHRLIYEDFLKRYRFAVFLFLGLFFSLSARLFYLQVIRGGYYRTVSEDQRTHIIPERGPRGVIYDCDGRVLVGNRSAFVAVFYPFSQDSRPGEDVLARLKSILPVNNLDESVLRGWKKGRSVRLSDNLTRQEMFQLKEQRLVLPGISVLKEQRREFRSPEANAHLVGYISEISSDELVSLRSEGYRPGDLIGRRGLEKVYDSYLRGQDGGWQIEVDALGRQTRLVRYIPPVIGASLHTTVDADLQDAAAQALAETPTGRGAVVALDPRSGAVRALVSAPGFDPGQSFSARYAQYMRDRDLPLFNRALQALYPPGSVFKIVTAAAGLQTGAIDPRQTFVCPGYFVYGNKRFNCWKKEGHGRVNLEEAVAHSCNVYFYQLALRLGVRDIERFARDFGYGEFSGIELPSEKRGLVPSPEWKMKKLRERWHPGDTLNMSIGQGSLWVTPLQAAEMTAAAANRGVYYRPYVAERIVAGDGAVRYRAHPEKKGEVKLSSRVWDILTRAMEQVTVYGTGRVFALPGIRVAGKTGTAQNPHGESHAWAVAYAPADDPQIAVAVVVENGGSGGGVAGPVMRKVLEAAFNLTPEEVPEREPQTVRAEER